jgi:hypothetical protein
VKWPTMRPSWSPVTEPCFKICWIAWCSFHMRKMPTRITPVLPLMSKPVNVPATAGPSTGWHCSPLLSSCSLVASTDASTALGLVPIAAKLSTYSA